MLLAFCAAVRTGAPTKPTSRKKLRAAAIRRLVVTLHSLHQPDFQSRNQRSRVPLAGDFREILSHPPKSEDAAEIENSTASTRWWRQCISVRTNESYVRLAPRIRRATLAAAVRPAKTTRAVDQFEPSRLVGGRSPMATSWTLHAKRPSWPSLFAPAV